MQEEDYRRLLLTLTPAEKKVLSLRCNSDSYKIIATKLGIRQKAVEYHLANIYIKLGLEDFKSTNERKRLLLFFICPTLKIMLAEQDEQNEKPQEEKVNEIAEINPDNPTGIIVLKNPKTLKLVKEDEDQYGLTVNQKQKGGKAIAFESYPEGTRLRTNIFSFLTGILFMVLVIGGYYLYSYLTHTSIPFISFMNSPTSTPFSQLVSVNSTPSQIVSTVIFTLTPFPISTQTRSPTITFTPTLIDSPTVTSTPPSTITPTFTPSPSPTFAPPGTILFEDNFDDGLSPKWEILNGDPETTKGHLTARGRTWLSVGDVGWKNIKIDFINLSPYYCGGDPQTPPLIGVRAADWYNFVAFHYGYCNKNVYKVIDNVYNEIPNSSGPGQGTKIWQKVEVIVENNTFSIYIDGQPSTSYTTDKFPSGKVVLSIDELTSIDNFIITALP